MAIDSVIIGVQITRDEIKLVTQPREDAAPIDTTNFVIENFGGKAAELEGLIGLEIWGNSSQLLVGDLVFAKRIGYVGLELVKGWRSVVAEVPRRVIEGWW